MPIYEFICNECKDEFEELVRSISAIAEVSCPACGSPRVEKKVSLFASRVVGGVFAGGERISSSCGTRST
jgi:putative FmdB family regulatory protein